MAEEVKHAGHPPLVVVALGGHAFMRAGETGTHDEHLRNAGAICEQLMTLVERGYHLVITHGNGPQVGAMLERDELSGDDVPSRPLDVLVAQTEGSLGYYLQQSMLNSLRRRDIRRFVVTVVTQVVVDRDDPAFKHPTKPVGPFLTEAEARRREREWGWSIIEDSGRGWRRVVPSPMPIKVIQRKMIREAALQGHIVIACGGGGIPVYKTDGKDYAGVEAVIDKDRTSGVLAKGIEADLLIILTAVDGAYLHFGTPDQTPLGAVTLAECARYIADGEFPKGSMGPKVEAVHDFLLAGGSRGLVTSPPKLREALQGEAGTHFIGKI
ncbi:MAG: carbamate kinase [Phycisphaeraceae bacterium]|nr:MAG: carbamate kinase [Phycisphaeraceae bacterium]